MVPRVILNFIKNGAFVVGFICFGAGDCFVVEERTVVVVGCWWFISACTYNRVYSYDVLASFFLTTTDASSTELV
jgi:hypothetical protein